MATTVGEKCLIVFWSFFVHHAGTCSVLQVAMVCQCEWTHVQEMTGVKVRRLNISNIPAGRFDALQEWVIANLYSADLKIL